MLKNGEGPGDEVAMVTLARVDRYTNAAVPRLLSHFSVFGNPDEKPPRV